MVDGMQAQRARRSRQGHHLPFLSLLITETAQLDTRDAETGKYPPTVSVFANSLSVTARLVVVDARGVDAGKLFLEICQRVSALAPDPRERDWMSRTAKFLADVTIEAGGGMASWSRYYPGDIEALLRGWHEAMSKWQRGEGRDELLALTSLVPETGDERDRRELAEADRVRAALKAFEDGGDQFPLETFRKALKTTATEGDDEIDPDATADLGPAADGASGDGWVLGAYPDTLGPHMWCCRGLDMEWPVPDPVTLVMRNGRQVMLHPDGDMHPVDIDVESSRWKPGWDRAHEKRWAELWGAKWELSAGFGSAYTAGVLAADTEAHLCGERDEARREVAELREQLAVLAIGPDAQVMLERHRQMLRDGVPQRNADRLTLEDELRKRIGRFASKPFRDAHALAGAPMVIPEGWRMTGDPHEADGLAGCAVHPATGGWVQLPSAVPAAVLMAAGWTMLVRSSGDAAQARDVPPLGVRDGA